MSFFTNCHSKTAFLTVFYSFLYIFLTFTLKKDLTPKTCIFNLSWIIRNLFTECQFHDTNTSNICHRPKYSWNNNFPETRKPQMGILGNSLRDPIFYTPRVSRVKNAMKLSFAFYGHSNYLKIQTGRHFVQILLYWRSFTWIWRQYQGWRRLGLWRLCGLCIWPLWKNRYRSQQLTVLYRI